MQPQELIDTHAKELRERRQHYLYHEVLTVGMWLLIGLLAAIVAVVVFKSIARRSIFKGRVTVPLRELHTNINDQVSFDIFSEVWTEIGKAYRIDPRLIRPTDTFAELSNADSWSLGKGEDELAGWLDRKRLGRPPELRTVLDFAMGAGH
jgi:hypothetical protein